MKYFASVVSIYDTCHSLFYDSNFKRIRKMAFHQGRKVSSHLLCPCIVIIYKYDDIVIRSKVKYNPDSRKYSNFRY